MSAEVAAASAAVVAAGYVGLRIAAGLLPMASGQQQAKSWELRAAMSMARLWRDQGKRDEAGELLPAVYGWFTEGFDSLDLKEFMQKFVKRIGDERLSKIPRDLGTKPIATNTMTTY